MYGKWMKKTPKTAIVKRGKTKPPQNPAEPWFPVSHEKFALDVAGGMTQHDAYIKNICPRAKDWKPSSVDEQASKIAHKVKPRIKHLQQTATDAGIADIIERKRVLTEVLRGRLSDFASCGKQGAVKLEIDKKNINSAALRAIVAHREIRGRGEDQTDAEVVRVEIRDPVPAIAELNRMEKVYDVAPTASFTIILEKSEWRPN